MKIFSTVLKLQNGHDFHRKKIKGHNSIKNVSGVTVLVLSTLSDDSLYLYKVSLKYSQRYESYRTNTIFLRKNFKGP